MVAVAAAAALDVSRQIFYVHFINDIVNKQIQWKWMICVRQANVATISKCIVYKPFELVICDRFAYKYVFYRIASLVDDIGN